jgi:hypothetical protein
MYSYTYWLATTEGSKLLPSTQSSLELHFLAQLSNFELLVDTQKKHPNILHYTKQTQKPARGLQPKYYYTYCLATTKGRKLLPDTRSSL